MRKVFQFFYYFKIINFSFRKNSNLCHYKLKFILTFNPHYNWQFQTILNPEPWKTKMTKEMKKKAALPSFLFGSLYWSKFGRFYFWEIESFRFFGKVSNCTKKVNSLFDQNFVNSTNLMKMLLIKINKGSFKNFSFF